MNKKHNKGRETAISPPVVLTEEEKTSQLQLDFQEDAAEPKDNFSNFIVYVDESGDANLESIDKDYPVFVLAFCVFNKRYYTTNLVPEVQSLKFDYFGHDMVILHEKEIRKKEPPFTFATRAKEERFMLDLSDIIQNCRFILIAAAILKNCLPVRPERNAYHIALSYCLENLYRFLQEKRQQGQKTFVVFESRGDKEDKELELEFRRICAGGNVFKIQLPFEIIIKSKQINSTGLQFADLFARPIGRRLIDPETQRNRAFEALEEKFFCRDKTKIGEGYWDLGLSIYPQKAKSPGKPEL